MNAPPRYPNTHSRAFSDPQQGHDRAGLPPPLPGISYMQYEEPSPPDTAGSSGYAVDNLEAPPSKRQRLMGLSLGEQAHAQGQGQGAGTNLSRPALVSPPDSSAIPSKTAPQAGSGRRPSTGRAPTPTNAAPAAPPGKSKRVRTGCLTCRDRHLKCDEGLPDCLNCRKSSRTCNRGIRLNFTEIQCKDPPILPPSADWSVQFQDESRLIASEYLGGLERYAAYDRPDPTPPREVEVDVPLQRYEPLSQGQDQQHHQHHHQQYHDQQQRQIMELPQPYPQYERYDMSNRDMNRSLNHGLYYQSTARPPQPQPEYPTYDESQNQRDMYAKRGTGSFAPVARHPPIMQSMAPPQQMAQSNDYSQTSFPSVVLPEQYPSRDDISRHSRSYRSSDISSVTSSLVPQHAGPASQSFRPAYPQGQQPSPQDGIITPPSEKTTGERDYLNEEEEIFYMQRYIDEVAIWMDSLDHQKHFGRIVPYLALKSPMLLNALLACGVKHLELTNLNRIPNPEPNNVHVYYDTATTQLLRSLQNPDRNMAECATTAVVLNVYEIMSEKPAARMSHIAGARALIRECGWDARSTGIAGACFWLNIGMEILSCLAFNWRTAWEPDQWGLDISFLDASGNGDEGAGRLGGDGNGAGITGHETHVRNAYDIGGGGEEDVWVHRIFYVVAKIANFRASVPRFQEPSPHDEQVRLQSRFAEWKRLKAMCDTWNNNCPRSMRPFGYAHRRSSKSLFPNVMLIRRAAVVGRLFYHMAMCLLHQINPLEPASSEENRAAQLHHAHQVCGIVAHTKDHGVASVAIRSLAIAACVLIDREEQQEALAILDRIHNDTGWRLGNVLNELKKAWGWRDEGAGVPTLAPLGPPPGTGGGGGGFGSGSGGMSQQPQQQPPQQQPPQQQRMPVPGMVNPLLARADFNRPDHPYQNWYRPPNGQNVPGAQGFWMM